MLGIVTIILGRYLLFGYLDPYGKGHQPLACCGLACLIQQVGITKIVAPVVLIGATVNTRRSATKRRINAVRYVGYS